MKSIKLDLNKQFYTRESITEAAKAFEKMIDVMISEEGNRYKLSLDVFENIDADEVKGEFVNYCMIFSKRKIKPHLFWTYNYEL